MALTTVTVGEEQQWVSLQEVPLRCEGTDDGMWWIREDQKIVIQVPAIPLGMKCPRIWHVVGGRSWPISDSASGDEGKYRQMKPGESVTFEV